MVDKPSESRNQAARYWKVFLSFLISLGRSIRPSFFHAANTSRFKFVFPSTISAVGSTHTAVSESYESEVVPELGSHKAAGIENMNHQIPLSPIARRSEKVDPLSKVTGIRVRMRRKMPAPYPRAMPVEDIREVVRESCSSYF